MALPPVWQPDPKPPRRLLSDWQGLLGFGIGGFVALVMIGVLIVMIAFVVLIFTGDGDAEDVKGILGAPAGEQGIGQAVERGDR